jgi:hypothetical protein
MRGPHPTSNFLTLRKAEEAAGIAISVVVEVRSSLRSLADRSG